MKITIRLREGKDDDISTWYESLASGERSGIIRDILRKAINQQEMSILRNNKVEQINLLDTKDQASDSVDDKLDRLLKNI